jgi:hypothetical protein
MSEGTVQYEVRLGRNFVRKGDPIKVKLPGKSQFRDGFTFIGFDTKEDRAVVREPLRGHVRYVALDGIKRKAVTKGGERKV